MPISYRHIPRRIVLTWVFVGTLVLLISAGLAMMARRMSPVHRGDPVLFWRLACGVKLEDQMRDIQWGGPVYGPRDGWYYYERLHMHGSDLYRVPESEALAHFDRVVELLPTTNGQSQFSKDVRAGFEHWSARRDRSAETLLADIHEARCLALQSRNPSLYVYRKQQEILFEQRHARLKWYWATITFEWLYLTGLVFIAAWPALRRQNWRHWAAHLSALPFLFMMPVYLGYSTQSFTSAGPRGGVLYSWLLLVCRGGSCSNFDLWILKRIPQVLEPVSLMLGTPMAITGAGMPGPTKVIFAGVIVALAVFLVDRLWRDFRRGRIVAKKSSDAELAVPIQQ